MTNDMTSIILGAIGRGAALEEYQAILMQYKDRGGSQEDALEILESARAESDEQTEDAILDVMDIAAGFCAARLRVW